MKKDKTRIENIIRQFQELSIEEQADFKTYIKNMELKGKESILAAIREKVNDNTSLCPHCKSINVVRNGTNKRTGNQRFLCRDCGKSFSATTGTVLFSLKKSDEFLRTLECLKTNMTIRESAKSLDVNIKTAFDWRHKMLAALSSYAPKIVNGKVQCDETEIPVNQKGCRNLNRKPRKRGCDFKRNEKNEGNEEGAEPSTIQLITLSSNTRDEIMVPVQTKRLSVKEINIAIRGRLAWDTILVTDKHRSYASFAEANNIHLCQLLGKEHVHKNDPSVNVQRVNNLHSRFKRFSKPFFGVSSKYIGN